MKYFFVFLFLPAVLFSQNYQNRKLVENSFVLLKNDKNLLPFKNLEQRDFYIIQSTANRNNFV